MNLWLENSSTHEPQRSVTGEFVYPWTSEICDWRIRLPMNLRDLWLENSSTHEPQRSVTGEFVYPWTSEICDWRIRLLLWTSEICNWRIRLPMKLRYLWLENSSTHEPQRSVIYWISENWRARLPIEPQISVTGEYIYPWTSEICDWRICLPINLRDLWLENSSTYEPQRSVTGEFVYLWTSEICDWRICLPINLRDL